MFAATSWSALVVLASLLGVSARTPPVGPNIGEVELVSNRYIVEFDSASSMQRANLKKRDNAIHEAVYSEMRARGILIKINQEYTADLFIGASISVDSDSDLANIASIEGVLNILPVRVMRLPVLSKPISGDGWVHADPSTLQPLNMTTNMTHSQTRRQQYGNRRVTGFSNLPQIQADQVHAQGNKGRGIKIGIIDGGVDYTRTPMGGCFGPGCKIAGGYDFVGDNYVTGTDPVPDADPLDKCDIHGTIVAGIIGADDNEYNVPGVTPEASLYQYRAFSCTGYTTEDVVFQAMQRAYLEGMDVVNMSIEFRAGWTEAPLAVMASRLVQAGIIVTAAAGNVDPEDNGPFYPSAPAVGRGVIGVGSVNSTILPAHNATTSTGYGPITYYNYKNFADGTYTIYTYPNDPTGCDAPNVDLSGVVVVVREGGSCDASIKAQNAFFQNAQGILYAQVNDNVEPAYENFPLIDNARVNRVDGDWLFANAGQTLTFTFDPVAKPNVYSGGIGSDFSSQGPTYELFMSTQVMTPGSNIIGVVPFNVERNFANWTITPGTSWSSAYAAGAAALYLNAQGTRNVQPRAVREALQYSARPIRYSETDSQLHTVAFQGAGLVQVFESINGGTVITPTELYLNDTQYFMEDQIIRITNSGRDRKDYTISNLAAGTALALNPTNNFTNYFPTPQVDQPATVKISDKKFSLRPGQSKDIKLEFKHPRGVDPKSLPIVSGFISVSAGGSDVSNIPYVGVAQRMRDVPVFDSNSAYFEDPSLRLPYGGDGNTGFPFAAGQSFSWVGSDFPTLYYRLAGGSKIIYLDLVRADTNLGLSPTFATRSFSDTVEWTTVQARSLEARKIKSEHGEWSTALSGLQQLLCRLTKNKLKQCSSAQQQGSSFARVPTVGNLFGRTLAVRSTNDFDTGFTVFSFFGPNFSNGTRVPNGNYRFLLRGLHVFGDPNVQADYESWVSEPFVIDAAN